MPKRANCSSNTTPGAAAGGPPSRPFTVAESLAAAEVVWATTGFPAVVVRVGICLDLAPGDLTPRRTVAARLHVSRAQIDALEMIWTLSDERIRFLAVRDAVRFIRARRSK